MPILRTAAEIADFALREVGSFAPTDDAPNPAHKAIALDYFDMMLAELAGVDGIWWLRPISQNVPLTQNIFQYDLNALLGTRLESFERAFLATAADPSGAEIAMLTKAQYEALPARSATGVTAGVYIERGINPQMFVYPTPVTGTTDQIRLYGQTYTPDLTDEGGNVPHLFPAAWQLWMIKQLAQAISGGPVARLPMAERKEMQDIAADKLALLKTMSNRQNLARPLAMVPDNLQSRVGSTWFR